MFKKILLIVAAMLLLLCGCSAAEPEEEMPVDYDLNRDCVVYYEAEDCLVPVAVEEAWNEDNLINLYSRMCASETELEGTGLSSILPSDTQIDTTVKDNIATVEIYAPSIDSLTATQARNIATAAVNTATQFDGIEAVQLVFNGSTEKLGGIDISEAMGEMCINPAYDIGNLTPFEVYYELGDTDYIVPITKAAKKVTADVAVNAMMKVPENKGVKSLFPTGTQLLSAELSDGILTLNFSKELSKLEESPEKQQKLLDQLVFMLDQLEGVDEVQILVEGVPFNFKVDEKSASVFGNYVEVLQ